MLASLRSRYFLERLLGEHVSIRGQNAAVLAKKTTQSGPRRLIIIFCVFILISLATFALPPESISTGPKSTSTTQPNRPLTCSAYPNDCEQVAPFIFDSIFSLLKQWPSSYAPNGHSVVPGAIAPNTLLYHASSSAKPLKKPTFFALDVEMSLGIYGSIGSPELRTAMTTKDLRILYLDGHSATLTATGTLDSQMAILHNDVPLYPSENLIYNEDRRALELCNLAESLNIDGFVRMNAGFEVLVCDYVKSGIRELFTTNITIPGNELREQDPSLPRDPNRQPPFGYGNDFSEQNGWEWVRSGAWHYGSTTSHGAGGSSETRVRLDICGFISWYDPRLRSLSGSHHGGVRGNYTYENGWGLRKGHRLLGVGEEDIATFREWLQAITAANTNRNLGDRQRLPSSNTYKCSGTDWVALTETVVNTYRTRAAEILASLEQNSSNPDIAHKTINNAYVLSHAILYPYLEYQRGTDLPRSEIKPRTLARCNSTYTEHIDPDSMNDFEVLLKESIQLVMGRLCQWAWDIFEWSDSWMFNRLGLLQVRDITTLQLGIKQYRDSTQTLMKWIGWDLWQGCETQCNSDELCYVPMWPVIYSPGKHQGGIYGGSILSEKEMLDFWTPKCLSRADFDCGGGRGREPKYQFPDVPYSQCKSLQTLQPG